MPQQVSVATVGLDRMIAIWDLRRASDPSLRIQGAHKSEVTAVAWHPAGGAIATGGADAAVKLWDWRAAGLNAGGKPLGSYAGHTGAVARMAFAPDGNQLASVGSDGCLIQWRVG